MVNVSVVVPVFNAKPYIRRCLDSCVSQTMQDIEIIVVDDASTDGTKEIIQEYVEEYPNLVKAVFQQKNSGYCTGINTGLKHARGQYIVFVEADDWVELDTCEKLWNAAIENDADMVGGDAYIETAGGGTVKKNDFQTCSLGKDNFENIYTYTLKSGLYWEKIYRRSMLEENNICFPDGIYSYGDSFFNTIAPLYAKDFVKLDFPFYHYYQHPEQSVKRRNDKKIYDRIRVAERIVETCKERGIYDDFKIIIDDKWFSQMMGSAIDCISRFDVPNMEALYQIRALCKQRIPDYKKSCRSYRSYMMKSRAFFNLIMMSPKVAKVTYGIASKILRV